MMLQSTFLQKCLVIGPHKPTDELVRFKRNAERRLGKQRRNNAMNNSHPNNFNRNNKRLSDELEQGILVVMFALPVMLIPVIYGIAHSLMY